MLPLIPFAAGILTGAVALRLLRSNKARTGLDKARSGLGQAQEKLRGAAISGLSAIETTSARTRERLAAGANEAQEAGEAAAPEAPAQTVAGDEEKAS